MKLITNYMTKNDCYISSYSRADRKMNKPYGIVVHSTGANNPNLRRYVQPDIEGIGKNTNSNSWNRSGIKKMVHAFIGKLANGNIATVNVLPYNFNCWGCASGTKGSFNFNPTAKIQFEICEDALKDQKYFDTVMKEAQEYCALLCKEFKLSVNTITSHAESHKLGYASNHGDIDHWLKKFNKDMNWFRNEVQKLIDTNNKVTLTTKETNTVWPVVTETESLRVGDKVKITGSYASSSTSLVALHSKAKGKEKYITKIYPGRRFPYQIGNKGKTDGKNTTGFAKETSLQKINKD